MPRYSLALVLLLGSPLHLAAAPAAQSSANGLIEDSRLSLASRLLYLNRDSRNGAANPFSRAAAPAGYGEETALGLRAVYQSGFTRGSLGFGIDAFALHGQTLDSGRGRAGIAALQRGSDGRSTSHFSRAGASLKLRLSDTTLHYGEQFVSLPVLTTDDSRLLPESVEGLLLSSREIDDLELHAGHFSALTTRDAMRHDGFDDGMLDSLNLLGGRYAFSEALSLAYYHSAVAVRDTPLYGTTLHGFTKHYGNASYSRTLGDEQTLSLDFNAYQTRFDNRNASDTHNRIWSLAAAWRLGAHTVTLAHQRSSGNAEYYYGVDGLSTIWLANSVQLSDYNGEDERSWQLRYDLDMAGYGVPGLSFMGRYITGSDITLRDAQQRIIDSNAGEHELNLETRYVIQQGAAKDLSLRLRSALYRASGTRNSSYLADSNELRLIVEYPLDIL